MRTTGLDEWVTGPAFDTIMKLRALQRGDLILYQWIGREKPPGYLSQSGYSYFTTFDYDAAAMDSLYEYYDSNGGGDRWRLVGWRRPKG